MPFCVGQPPSAVIRPDSRGRLSHIPEFLDGIARRFAMNKGKLFPCRSLVWCVMNAVKGEAIRPIQSLPDDCSFEEIQYHLHVIQKAERGLAAIDEGRVVSQEEAERRSQRSWNQYES